MKKATTTLLTIILALGMILALPFKTTAASNTAQDGLEITISTGKETYTANDMASSLGEWSVVNAHSLVTFIERFSNSIRKPN